MRAIDQHTFPPRSKQPVLVGRQHEQQQLRDLLDSACTGNGRLVLVSGEAGIGKTTLVRDLIQQAEEQGALVLSGGCYDLTTTPPYGPWIEMIRAYPTTEASLPELPDQLRQGGGMAGIASQAELFELARDFFAEVSARQPLVLVLEDLHWSDPASLELLRYLGRTCDDNAILLGATYRDDDITRQHELYQLLPLIIRESRPQRIHLARLDRDAVQEIVESRYALDKEETARLVAHIGDRAEGNPFFVGELLQGLEEEQVLRREHAGWELGDLDQAHLPLLLLQVLDTRLARLSSETRAALQVAAVVGQEMSLDLWQTVLDVNEGHFDRIIAEAVEARVIEETRGVVELHFRHALLREALYESLTLSRRRLRHRQVGETLAEMPNPDPDTIAHHFQQARDPRAPEWLVGAAERAIRLYVWKTAIERFETALELLKAAGAEPVQQGWLHYRIGRLWRYADPQQGARDLEAAERLAIAAGDRVLAAFALADRGLLRCYAGDVRQGLEEMLAGDRALEALESESVPVDDALLTRVADALPAVAKPANDDRHRLAWGLNIRRGGLVTRLAMAGRYAEALALGEPHAEWIATLPEGDDILRAAFQDVQMGLGAAYAAFGRPNEAREAFRHARTAYRRIDHNQLVGISSLRELIHVVLPYQTTRLDERQRLADAAAVILQRTYGVNELEASRYHPLHLPLLLLEGRWDTVHDVAVSGLDNRMSEVRWAAMVGLGQLARLRGDPDLAWQQVQAICPEGAATEPGNCDPYPAMSLQRVAIALALDASDLETARTWIDAYARWLTWSRAIRGRAELELCQARFGLLSGDQSIARHHAEQALAKASDPEQPLALIASRRFLGHLDTRDGRFAEAVENLQAALDLADACQAPFERALILLELARLRIAQHQPDEARQILAEIRAICEPLKAQPTLDQVAELEAELTDQPAETPFGLTPRELDVLRLVAEGLTDPEVAEQLFVSPRTVSSHLTSVYTKLSVSSRTAATRLAVEHRLLSH